MEALIWKQPISKRKVAGLTLIERARRAARKAGCDRVRVVDNLTGIGNLKEPFLLIRGDVVFGMEALESFIGARLAMPDTLLILTGDRSGREGGIYACPADFAETLMREGGFEKAAQVLGAAGRSRVEKVQDDLFWRVSTGKQVREAERALRLSLYRTLRRPTENWVLRNINRPVSRWISYLLVRTPLTPNQISLLVIPIAFYTALLLAKGDPVSVALGGILFQFRSVLDCCDGEVARLKLAWSKKGQWIDTASDNVCYLLFLGGAIAGMARQGFHATPYLAVAALFGTTVTLGLMVFYLVRYSNSGSLLAVDRDLIEDMKRREQTPLIWLIFKLKFVMKKDYFSLIFMALCLAGKLPWILILTAMGTNVSWVALVTLKKEFSRVLIRPEA